MRSGFFLLFSAAVVFSVCGLEPGEKMPGFANPDLNGTYFTSKNVLGKSWLLLDFFATWCEPCKKEMPELETLGKDFADTGLKVIVFATDTDGERVVKPFFQDRPDVTTVLIDRYSVTAGRFKVDNLPTVFLVDPEGIVRYKASGYSEKAPEEIRRILTNRASGKGTQ